MHSDQPIEARCVNDSNHAIADAPWRAEVASRVCSYQARRKRRYTGDNPALDFGPADSAQTVGTQPARSLVGSTVGNTARNAIDTNYYRRLNAESMGQESLAVQSVVVQSASGGLGDPVAATLSAQPHEAESEARPTTTGRDSLPERDTPDNDPALDLEIRTTVAADSLLDRYCFSAAEDSAPQAATPKPEAEPSAAPVQGNLIVFPRPTLEPPLLPQPSRDELAEPMRSRPRILEVPEDIMPIVQGSLFPEIRLDGDEEERAGSREPEIEVPLRVAPLSARLMAGLMDLGMAVAAGLLFAAMAWHALPGIPHAKPFWMTLGAVTVLLWAVYQHLFLLYGGRTFGMRMRGIRLSTFDGQPPTWEQRRRRARFMVISLVAVTLGFLWALADEDALCWHDRISRTFPTTE